MDATIESRSCLLCNWLVDGVLLVIMYVHRVAIILSANGSNKIVLY